MSQQNPNTGTLWPNHKRNKAGTSPHFSGALDVQCPHCNTITPLRVAAWVKTNGTTTKNNAGEFFFSLAVSEPEQEGGDEQ